jgi:hypothetical protein
MADIESELTRRAETGGLLPTLAAEMSYLRDWAARTFPGTPPPAAGTLENNLHDLFNELRRVPQN